MSRLTAQPADLYFEKDACVSQSSDLATTRQFQDASDQFGYRYSQMQSDEPGDPERTPLFRGVLGVQALSCGINLCASDLVSLTDSEHEGMLTRSYTIAVNFDAEQTETQFGDNGSLMLLPGSGAVVSASDDIRMASRIRAGMRSRCLLLQIQPEAFGDDDLAEEIYQALNQTTVTNLTLCGKLSMLARELTTPSFSGVVGRLMAESAALEFLARTLVQTGASEDNSASLARSDYMRVAKVRDLLLSDPGLPHTLDQLAREAGMSISSLKVKFPQAFGKTVFAYLADIRLERAQNLIQSEGWSISRAAHFVGYNHQSNFAAAFKRRFGYSPNQLKRR
ncbi:MAG: AraC family transcriptional regulator [Pseudomonadota bacterium]